MNNLQKAYTPQARRALADALVRNKRVVDRFYKMHTNHNRKAYAHYIDSIDPQTLIRPDRKYFVATPRVKKPANLHTFLGDEAYNTVAAQHTRAGLDFIADNNYLKNNPAFTNNINKYKAPEWLPTTKRSVGDVVAAPPAVAEGIAAPHAVAGYLPGKGYIGPTYKLAARLSPLSRRLKRLFKRYIIDPVAFQD